MNDWVQETYENHRQLLFRVAWLVLRRSDLAEDAVHTAFSRIVSRPPVLNGNAKGCILKAVRNAAIDLSRQLNRHKTEVIVDWEDFCEPEKEPENQKDSLDAIFNIIQKMDSTTQEIIHLHLHEQLSFREIGELVDVPLQTVASRYRRALQQIKVELNQHDQSD